jgi:hypothetical protein
MNLCPGACRSELLLSNEKEIIDGYKDWLSNLKGDYLYEKDISGIKNI